MKHTVNEIHKFVMKNKTVAKMQYVEDMKLFYTINVENVKYTFPIDISDRREVGNAIFNVEEKASLLIRYIRIAEKNNEIRYIEISDKGDNL